MNETEKTVFRIANQWINGSKDFTFHTSGSTGQPKDVLIERHQVVTSVKATFDFIDPTNKIKSTLLCIDPQFIGGAMVVLRALIKNLDLFIIEPSRSIVECIPDDYSTDLVSLVPMQFQAIRRNELSRFNYILVGGAPLDHDKKCIQMKNKIYATYGMTETVSHIALRLINENEYHTTGDTKVRLNQKGCLQFKGEITNYNWLTTNDLGDVVSPTIFKWIGRKDFVINSGGIKINPEKIERKLSSKIHQNFIISSVSDDLLGEKVVLIVENDFDEKIDFSCLEKYEVPKNIFYNIKIEKTASGKINRRKTKENLLHSLR